MPRLRPTFVSLAVAFGLVSHRSFGVQADSKQAGLAIEEIHKVQLYGANATKVDLDGWFQAKGCLAGYCVYHNRWYGNGGLSLITDEDNYQKARKHLANPGPAEIETPSYKTEELPGGEIAYIANTTVRRAARLVDFYPVLIVNRRVFDELPEEEHTQLLKLALELLPEETQQRFYRQNSKSAKDRSIKGTLFTQPFNMDLGMSGHPPESNHHHVNYPDVAGLEHDCRPNSAYYIDPGMRFHATAARKIEPGERISISLVMQLLPRADRQRLIKKLRGHECTCKACTGGGDIAEVNKADARLEGIESIQKKLVDYESTDVTPAMIARYVDLYKQDRLESKIADAYWHAALNYNFLGELKLATQHCNRAVQAAIVEGGDIDNNDVIERRIMLKDPTGHYSYKYKIKKQQGTKG